MKFENLLNNEIFEIENTVKVIEDDLDVIISIPHSSIFIPIDFKKNRFWNRNILRDTDIQTDKLFNFSFGTKIIGLCNPYFVNYSRSKESFDDKRGVLAWQFLDGTDLLKIPYTKEEVNSILSEFYDPYHLTLQKYIDKMKAKRGFALVIDGHGMAKYPLKGCVATPDEIRPDFCVGTLDGKSCPKVVEDVIEKVLSNSNYSYSFNRPYKGGFITQNYSMQDRVYVIQIETVKENYINNNYEINNEFEEFQSILKEVILEILKILK